MKADQFVRWETLMIMGLGLVAFILDSMVGVIFVKILNIFTPKNKINPMVGAAGISAFPMSSRVIEKMGQEADSQNHLLMHAVAANVSGRSPLWWPAAWSFSTLPIWADLGGLNDEF